jgi:hypothetical protein
MFERAGTATGGTTLCCCCWLDGLCGMVSGSSGALHLGIGYKGIIFNDESLKPKVSKILDLSMIISFVGALVVGL